MKKIREYYICDRCKKELEENKINHEFYNMWCYDLCDKCKELFNSFETKVNSLKNQWQDLEIEYKFGTYLPREDDLESKGE